MIIIEENRRLSRPLDRWKGPPGVDFRVLLARIDGFRSLDRWTANLRSLDSARRLAPRRARKALIFLRSLADGVAHRAGQNRAPARRTDWKSVRRPVP